MTYRLKTYVTAIEQGGEGRAKTFGPGDDLSLPENAWALKAISNPLVWDGEVPPLVEPEPHAAPAPATAGAPAGEVERLRSRVSELEGRVVELEAELAERTAQLEAARGEASGGGQDDGGDPDGEGQGDVKPLPVPPMRGSGSSAADWRAYARSLQVEVADDASRDDVIAALEEAGKPIK